MLEVHLGNFNNKYLIVGCSIKCYLLYDLYTASTERYFNISVAAINEIRKPGG